MKNENDSQKTVKQEWYVTDLFQLTKGYEQILRDHVLIEAMKNTLHEAKADRFFCEMIQEAYFQCGIILRNIICGNYLVYQRLFIYRSSQNYWNAYVDLDKGKIACMVHLLLTKRKYLPEGVGFLLDCIEEEICNRVGNPFNKLYAAGKYKHEIDFGVNAKPLSDYAWENVNWRDLGFLIPVSDRYYINSIDDVESGKVNFDGYIEELKGTINDVMEFINFKEIEQQLKLLDKIGDYIHFEGGCSYTDCNFYCDRPLKCKCESSYEELEPYYYNPLKKKLIEEMKQNVISKFEKEKQKSIPKENKSNIPIYLSGQVNKTDMGRIIYSLCKMNAFRDKEGKIMEINKVFRAFGDFLHENYSKPNNYIKTEINISEQLEIFSKMNNTFLTDYNEKIENRKNR